MLGHGMEREEIQQRVTFFVAFLHAMSIALKYQIDFYQINIKKKQRKCN